MALVTIGIPVYNERQHLEETLISALQQTITDVSIVISDNGSTDGTPDIITRYAAQYDRIKAVLHPENRGPTANFWSLLEHTSSPYFVLLGGHDIFLPEYVATAVEFLKSNPEYVMAYPRSKLVDGNDELLGYRDSDIDTTGLTIHQGMLKTVTNLSWCTCFHGVYRTDVIRRLPTLKIQGSDNLFLFAAAYYGHIRFLDMLGILRRESRQETPEMVEKRRIAAGNYGVSGSRLYSPLSVMAMEHVCFVLEKTGLPFAEKMRLAGCVALAMRRKYGVSLPSMCCAFAGRKGELS